MADTSIPVRRRAGRRPATARPRLVRVLAFDRFEMLDVVGPLEAFATAATMSDGAYRVEVVAVADGLVRSSSNLSLLATGIRRAGTACDTLLIAGGIGVDRAAESTALLDWIRSATGKARRFGSVCTGALLLARAGLLDGHPATTHWKRRESLQAMYPTIDLRPDRIFIQDGRLWTSAGVTAGIDMALAMIEQDLGPQIALRTARELVVYLKRPGGQSQFSLELAAQHTKDPAIRRVMQSIAERPDSLLTLEALAAQAAMSPRHFSRRFRAETGRTPADYVTAIRIARAARLLESGPRSLDEIAHRCGFASADVLRRRFVQQIGILPSDYRARFRSAFDHATAPDLPHHDHGSPQRHRRP